MVRKIDKFLAKLTKKEREQVKEVVEQLLSGNTKHLDVKKLKGFEGIYRVRIGNIRILYYASGGIINILTIERRSSTTFKKK